MRACVRHWKLNVRLRECEYVHCSGCGAVRAQSSLPVSSVHGFGVWGAARSHDQKVKRLPTLRGGPAQRPHQIHLDRPPGRPCRESPGLFVLSLSHSWGCNRQWVVNPPARLPWLARRQAAFSPQRRASPRLIKRQRR